MLILLSHWVAEIQLLQEAVSYAVGWNLKNLFFSAVMFYVLLIVQKHIYIGQNMSLFIEQHLTSIIDFALFGNGPLKCSQN